MSIWWLRLGPHLTSNAGQIAAVLGLMLVGVGVTVLMPWPLKLIVDFVLTGNPLPESLGWISKIIGSDEREILLLWLAISTLVLYLAQQGFLVLQSYLQAGVGKRLMYSLGGQLFDRLQRLSLKFHSTKNSGDLVRRITTDSQCIQELVISVAIPMLTSIVTLVIMFLIMWNLNSWLSLVALMAAIPIPVLIALLAPRMSERTYVHEQSEGRVMSLAEQNLTNMPVVQAFGQEDHEHERFKSLTEGSIKAYMRAIIAQLQFNVVVNACTSAGTAVMMIVGGMAVLNGSLTTGSLLVFLAYVISLYGPLETLAYISSGYASASARARRVFEILDAEQEVEDREGATVFPKTNTVDAASVTFENVSFGYETGTLVLKNINLDVPAGQTIALVGASGAGKTTLASLIPRFFDPVEGRLLLNGLDLRDIELESLRRQVSVVLQEPFLLPLTVAENIAYGRPEATDEDIVAAALAANADEFIRQLPGSYQASLSERGMTLSGGQRQRLAIARAILKDSPILILDEPTSALDSRTEALILQALKRLMSDRTTFIIAHRLSTIRDSDVIAVIDAGGIVEKGTHSELIAAQGHYRRFYMHQFGDRDLDQHGIQTRADEVEK